MYTYMYICGARCGAPSGRARCPPVPNRASGAQMVSMAQVRQSGTYSRLSVEVHVIETF